MGVTTAVSEMPVAPPMLLTDEKSDRIPAVHDDADLSTLDHSLWEVLPREWELSDFKPIQKLYRGYASKVYLAEDNGKVKKRGPCGRVISVPACSNKLVVLKVYDLLRLSPLTRYQLDREVRLHSQVDHPNIIRLISTFTQADFRILVQEYAQKGDLYHFLHRERICMSEKKLVQLVIQPCLSVLAYLHTKRIVHRDIKPENLLLDERSNIKLADFGLSISLDDEPAVTRAGTLDYMAPEVLVCPLKRLPTDYKNDERLAYSEKVDSWSMGVLTFELLSGHAPFQQRDENGLLAAIKQNNISFPSHVSELAKDWIQHALVMDVATRATIVELLEHPWISQHARQPAVRSMPMSIESGTDSPSAQPRGVNRRMGAAVVGDDAARASAANRVDEQGCRSPAPLHIPTGGQTPNPFSTASGGTPRGSLSRVNSGTARRDQTAARRLSQLSLVQSVVRGSAAVEDFTVTKGTSGAH